MLSDSTSFTGDNIGVANFVQQSGLTMVHVTHDGDHRWTQLLCSLVFVVAVIKQRLQFHLFLLTWLDQ